VDGGVAENTPISHAIALAASEIYVLPTGHAYALERPPALDAPSTSRTPPS
jgi:NTE family protein